MAKKKIPPPPPIKGDSYLIDSHCHLDMGSYEKDLEAVLARAKEGGVKRILTIGIDEASSRRAVELARNYPAIRASVGVHPHDVDRINDETLTNLTNLARNNHGLVVAYGEIGLDYVKQFSPAHLQKKYFGLQLELARELELPIIIHDREAHDDILDLLEQHGPFDQGGVMHCFSGDKQFAEKVLEFGLHISIPGIVTFNNARDLQEVAESVPLNRLILETDGPFLAPVPRRGKRNEPAYLAYTAQKVAELRGITLEVLARETSRNVERLFRL
ncbi:MAG: TatD family hydrolase [Thermodesulfobacteriota bacterium]